MLHKIIYATLILFLTMGMVSAQMPQPGMHLNEDSGNRPHTKEQRAYDKAVDRAYQDANKKIPEQQKKSDPWGNIRPAPPDAAKNK